MKEDERISYLINHYGLFNQLNQTTEELGELIVAINKFRRTNIEHYDESVNNILEEIADVIVMIMQLVDYFGFSKDLERVIDYKIDRQIERIRKETLMVDKEQFRNMDSLINWGAYANALEERVGVLEKENAELNLKIKALEEVNADRCNDVRRCEEENERLDKLNKGMFDEIQGLKHQNKVLKEKVETLAECNGFELGTIHLGVAIRRIKNQEIDKLEKALDEALWELAKDCIGYSKEEICFDKSKEKCIECRKQVFIKKVEENE